MATADTVTVRLEADTASYLRDIKQADTQFTAAMGHINSQAPRAAGAMNGLSGQVGNVAAQFQDIGVQFAGGQSPLLIALQQGTQLTAVLQTTANPVRALGAAFASLVSPVSLVTIATIALGGAALQYFGTLLGDGRDATEVIKEQNDLIRKVADNWGDAVPSLRAYIDELDRAADTADLSKAYDTIISNAFAGLRAQLPDLRAELAAASLDLQRLGANDQEIDALQQAFANLQAKVEDGTATSADLDAVLAQLAGTTGSATVPSLVNLQAVLGAVAQALASAANAAAQANEELAILNNRAAGRDIKARFATDQFVAEQERLNGLTAEQLALEREVARVKAEATRGGVLVSEQQALTLAQQRLAAEKARAEAARTATSSGKASAAAANDAERERQAVLDLIDALTFEQSLLGMTAAEKAVQNALRRAGAAATDEERAAIEQLVTATYDQQAAIRAAEQSMQVFQNLAQQSLTGFIGDLREGKSAAEALSNVFDNLANQLINIAVQGLVQAAFGGLFGGGGGSFLGGLFGGRRAAGGTVQQGKGYIVGERGPEPFFPTTSGTILPNSALRGEGGSGGAVEVRVSLDGPMLTAEIVNVSGKVAAASIGRYDGQLQNTMAEKSLRYGGA